MEKYTIKTDAEMQTIEASSMDEAVKIFTRDWIQYCETVAEFFEVVDGIDGAWAWIDSDGSEPRQSSENCYAS